MRKLNKRVREEQFNGCSMERYAGKCDLGVVEKNVCTPQCNFNGIDNEAMGMVRDNDYRKGYQHNHVYS